MINIFGERFPQNQLVISGISPAVQGKEVDESQLGLQQSSPDFRIGLCIGAQLFQLVQHTEDQRECYTLVRV